MVDDSETYSSAGFTLIAISANSPFSLSNMKWDRHELRVSTYRMMQHLACDDAGGTV